ncbi:helix-turn-helix domain-containing protein [Anaeroarcus burkinensis]|uniref:helix-turn-helix domain-containing protein n=1 Tax=Anaeroarcus burkinensis TaxID=82376 RepID=UPI0004289349|nr:helix-turn-helix domain-containing protein [Anaeroarcus burkinensis]
MTREKSQRPLAVTIKQAGELLGISRSLAYQMARQGELPTVKLGKRRLLVSVEKLEQMLNKT